MFGAPKYQAPRRAMTVLSVAAAATSRDWTALPAVVLAGVARRLTFLDYTTLRKVSRFWAYWLQDVPPSPQVPYLLFPGEDGESTFLSLPDDKYYRLSVPALRGKVCIGCQHGWLATLDAFAEPALLNPITGRQIALPSITTLPSIYATYAPDGSLSSYFHRTGVPEHLDYSRYEPDNFHGLSFVKIVLSSSPDGSGGFTAVALQNACRGVMFTSAGEDRWHLYDGYRWDFDDVIFHRGRFLAVSWNGIVHALEIRGGLMEAQVIMDPWTGAAEIREETSKYLQKFLVADDATGDLLQVWRSYEWTDDSWTTDKIKVFRCDQKQNRLIPLDDLGDRALFLGVGSSMMLSSREVRGLRRNCIYLTDNWWHTIYADSVRAWNRDVGIYNLENATFEPYHPPDPRFNWPTPVWITPALS